MSNTKTRTANATLPDDAALDDDSLRQMLCGSHESAHGR